MARANFDACHAVTAKWEGGWSDHPQDRGGKTMYGVTEAAWKDWCRRTGQAAIAVRNITRAMAEALYKVDFWGKAGCETLAAGVDLATYDAAVNSGVSRARKWLMASVGGTDVQTIKRICATRLSFVRGLGTFKTFGNGWTRRIVDIEVKSVAMNLKWSGASAGQVRDRLKIEGGIAGQEAKVAGKAAKSGAAGGAATGAAGGTGIASGLPGDWGPWLFLALALIAFGFALVMHRRGKINAVRAEAYTIEAEGTKA